MAGSAFEDIGVMAGIAVVYPGRHPVYSVAVETIRFSQVRIVRVRHISFFIRTDLAVLGQFDELLITAMAFETEGLGIFFCLNPGRALFGETFVRVFQISRIMTGQAIFSRAGVSKGQHAFPCHRSSLKHVTRGASFLFVPDEWHGFFV
jgi:hypothetical protein